MLVMSWLYTIIFTGLVFSSQGSSAPTVEPSIQSSPAAVEVTRQDETEKFAQSYPLNANGRVSVSNVNGSIIVEAWDRPEVKLEYTKTADSKERLADVEIRIESKPDSFSVETDYGNWKSRNGDRWKNGGKLNVDYHLMVPRGAILNEIETVNGSVAVSNFVNLTKVSAVNGSVNATNLRGTANLSTVNGEVNADFDRLETGSKVILSTVNGHVNLVIPSDSSTTINADSLNGNISNDFGLPVRKGKYVGRDLYGRIGSGDVRIKLDSVNGALSIGRKNDGKPLSPATNLLPQKEKDDEDWDNDDEDGNNLKSAKINKDVEKALKDSQKESAKAVKDAQKEIERIKPEIARIDAESVAGVSNAIERAAEIQSSAQVQQRIKEAQIQQRAVLASIADAGFTSGVTRVEKKSESFPVKGVPTVTVYAEPCSVKVVGWEKNEVQYRVVQHIGARRADPLSIIEEHTDSTVKIIIDEPKNNNGLRYYGDGQHTVIEVFVPRRSNLKITANGELRVEGVSGNVELNGSAEPINVRDLEGKLRVTNMDGMIRVIGFHGDIDAETSDGMINLEGDFTKLKVHASDGPVTLTLPENASADLESSCDEIQGDGVDLVRLSSDENRSKYRIGRGGVRWSIDTEGEIRIRAESKLRASF